MKKTLISCAFIFSALAAHSQILISILLGDKLNSEKLEFGMAGGINFMSLSGIEGSTATPGFNLGFYFDIKTNSKYILHTGALVKSPMGAKGIVPYDLHDPTLNAAFEGGEVIRKLRYFNVPLMIKRPFGNLYAEGGFMVGVMGRSYDEFKQTVNQKEDLTFKLYNRNSYHPFDVGPVAGIGYRLMKGHGMNLGLRYYYGLVDITLDDSGAGVFNRSWYISVGIPVGAGKVKEN